MFKVGSRVKIKKVVNSENESTNGCWWNNEMDEYIGKVITLKRKTDRGNWEVEENNWFWLEEWIELVEEKLVMNETKLNEDFNIGYRRFCGLGVETFIKTNQLNSNNMGTIKKMTMALKRILKGDLRKQYKAGLINEDTSLTEAGEEIRDDVLGQDERVQKALTERAEEIIKEAK